MKLTPTLNNPLSFFSALAPARTVAARAEAPAVATTSRVAISHRSGIHGTWQVGADGRLELKWRVISDI